MAEYRTVTAEAVLSNPAIEAEGAVSRSAIDADAEAMRVVFAVSDYLVTLTLTDESRGVADRTVREILQAHRDGKRVLLQGLLGDVWFQVPVATIYQTGESDDSLWAVQSYAVTLDENGSTLLTLVFPWDGGSGSAFSIYANPLEVPTAETMEYDGNRDYSAGSIGAAVKAAYVKPAAGIPAADLEEKYAGSATAGGVANKTMSIPMGQLASTSTSTVMTATIDGITELRDGVCVWLKNGVVTSASGFTININGLGAKPVYSSQAAATAATTLFNINYTALLIYNSTRVEGGCWDYVYGYDSNTNTIGYQVRTNSSSRPMQSITYRYRLLFESADGTKWVPSTNSTSTNATAKRDVNQTPINPFGEIVYYGTTASVSANSSPAATALWQEYTFTLGYAFNRTGAALVLPYPKPIYIKCAPQADGSAIIDADEPYVTAMPSTNDGKIYIYLGRTYSATAIEMVMNHPVYYHNGTGIRIWTGG